MAEDLHDAFDFRVLGRMEVFRGRHLLHVSGKKPLGVLALLLINRNSPVSSDVLIDALWGENPPASARRSLQTHIWQLRQDLELSGDQADTVLTTQGSAYQIQISGEQIDSWRFAHLVEDARRYRKQNNLQRSSEMLTEALALWRGPAFADLRYEEFAQPEIRRLEELHRHALEEQIELELQLGRHGEIIGTLQSLVAQEPVHEIFWKQLVLALYRSGRETEALAAYDNAVETLAKEIGVTPGKKLRELRSRIETGDPHLDWTPPAESTRLDDVPSNNLPHLMGKPIGRESELRSLLGLLDGSRLVTITGPGGVGKTMLALTVAEKAISDFKDGIWLVDFAPIQDARSVARGVASALGVENQRSNWLQSTLESLRDRQTLLLLDNCEHVKSSVSRLVEDILQYSPQVKVLATSREPLGTYGETISTLAPLDMNEAVELLVQRTKAGGLGLEQVDDQALERLCERLDRLPLAVEIAAGRLRHMSVNEMIDNLDDRFSILTTGSSTLSRHQTLEATVDFSYDLLDPDIQREFRALSVFTGGFTLDTAESFSGERAIEAVGSLIDKSLLNADTSVEPTRYRMLETIRTYGLERLDETGELQETRRTHLAWAVEFASKARRGLGGEDEVHWIRAIDSELDNLRAAMEWAIDDALVESGLLIFGALHEYWDVKAIREGSWWADLLLAADTDDVDARVLGWALLTSGILTARMGRGTEAKNQLDRARTVFDELGNASAAGLTSILWTFFAPTEQELAHRERISDLLEMMRDEKAAGFLVMGLTYACGKALELQDWAWLEALVEDLEQALSFVPNTRALGHLYEFQAELLVHEGSTDEAVSYVLSALDTYQDLGCRLCTSHGLLSSARCAIELDARQVAAHSIGSASAIAAQSGWEAPEQFRLGELMYLRDEWPEEWTAGYQSPPDEAIEYVHSALGIR